MSYMPLAHLRRALGLCVRIHGSTARSSNRMQQKGPKILQNPALNPIGLELKPRLKNGSARSGSLLDGRVSLRGAGTLLSVEITRKNEPLTAIFEGLEVQTPNSCSTAPTRAVALRSPHRRMLRSPRMAGGDENSRVRAFIPATRGRLLSESWKLK